MALPVAGKRGDEGRSCASTSTPGRLETGVTACKSAEEFGAFWSRYPFAYAKRMIERFGLRHSNPDVRLAATQKRTEHQEQEIRNLSAALAAVQSTANQVVATTYQV